ncbi:hypothetical protein Plhal304r1_c003g0010131 [Plasmopara halstedii]
MKKRSRDQCIQRFKHVSNISSYSSLNVGSSSKIRFSNTKWHVEHANSAPHAPSSSKSFSWVTSSSVSPTFAFTVVRFPSPSIKSNDTCEK